MPITTGNFKKLVQQGIYDGTIFHRVARAREEKRKKLLRKHVKKNPKTD